MKLFVFLIVTAFAEQCQGLGVLICGEFDSNHEHLKDLIGFYGPSNKTNEELIKLYPPLPNPSYSIFASGINTWYIYSSDKSSDKIARLTSEGPNFEPITSSFFEVIKFAQNKYDYNLIQSVYIRSIEDPVYTIFGGAFYTALNFSTTLSEADLVCKSLDGVVASPISKQAQDFVVSILPSLETSYWTGIYQDVNTSSPIWRFGSNDGMGTQFTWKYEGGSDTSGCLVIEPDQKYIPSSCDSEHQFICQCRQHHFFNDNWIRFHEENRDFETAKQICENEGHMIWWMDDPLSLSSLIENFGYSDKYWTGLTWDSQEKEFSTESGFKLTPSSLINWEIGHPKTGDCVVLNHRLYLETDHCNQNHGFLCGYKIDSGVSASFGYSNTWSWASNNQYTYQDGKDQCHSNGHELLTVTNINVYAHLIEKLYLSQITKFWINLDNTTSFYQQLISTYSENLCPQLVVDRILYINYVNCSDTASTICKQNDFFNISRTNDTTYFCPTGFELFGSTVCYGYIKQTTYWTRARKTCDTWGSLTGLYDYNNPDVAWKNGMLSAFLKYKNIPKSWLDLCGQGNTTLKWTSSFHEGQPAFNDITTNVQHGYCASYHLDTTQIPISDEIKIKKWNRNLPFVCEALPRTEEWFESDSISNVFTQTSDLLSSSYCQLTFGYQPSNRQCVGLQRWKNSWENVNCDGGLFTFKILNDYHFLTSLVETYQWISEERVWVGLCYTLSQGLRWADGTSAEEVYKPWAVEPKFDEDFCVAVDHQLYWYALPCNMSLMAWCTAPQCFRTTPRSYVGDVSVTRSGLSCQNWLSQTPHKHDYDVTNNNNSYCRAFDDNYFSPFCLTKNEAMRIESCDISVCGFKSSSDIIHTDIIEDFKTIHYVSDWFNEDTVMTCGHDEVLMDCKCSNEHCYGAGLDSSLEETNNFGPNSCLFYFTDEVESKDVMTKGNLYCRNITEDTMITRTVVETNFTIISIQCPAKSSIVGCFSVETNNSLTRYQPSFGAGSILGNTCYPQQSTSTTLTTTICLTTSNQDLNLGGTQFDLTNKTISFNEDSLNSYLAINTGLNDFQTFCMWVKVEKLGTLVYAAENGKSPIFSVSQSSQDGIGIFVTPTMSIPFQSSIFSKVHWQLLCIRLGNGNPSSDCKLTLDGFQVASTQPLNQSCYSGGFRGHIILGSGNVFLPKVTYNYNQTKHVDHNTLETLNGDNADLSNQFVGEIGPIYTFLSRFETADVKSFTFQCNGELNGQQSTLSLTKDVYVFGDYTTKNNSYPCLESKEKYSISTELNIEEPNPGTFSFVIDLIPISYEALSVAEATEATLKLEFIIAGSSEASTLVAEETINILSDFQQFQYQVSDLNLGAVYEVKLVVTVINELLQNNFLGVTNIEKYEVTSPSVVLNIRSDLSEPSVQGRTNIIWDQPDIGAIDFYQVVVYPISITNEVLEKISTAILYTNRYTIATSSNLVPGQNFICYVSGRFKEKLGLASAYTTNTQPLAPRFTSFQNVTKRSVKTVILTLFWEHHFSEFIDYFNLSYAANIEGSQWKYENLSSTLQSFQVVNLLPLTEYTFLFEAVANQKRSYTEIEILTTGDLSKFNMEVYRLSDSRILIEWDISNECYKYEIIAKLTGPIVVGDPGCDSAEDINIPTMYCNNYIREYQKLFKTEVNVYNLGCIYQVNVLLFKSSQDKSSSLSLEKIYHHPTQLTQLTITVTTINESTVEVKWPSPSLSQLVDRFLVTIKTLDTDEFFQTSSYIPTNQFQFSDLLPGTLYNVTASPIREGESGVLTWSLVWTPLLNELEVYHWTSWITNEECSLSCGNGTLTRIRKCLDPIGNNVAKCNSTSMEIKIENCNTEPCIINGEWSIWSKYTQCTATCGNFGKKERSRTCSNPYPSAGGINCTGDTIEKVSCPEFGCPVYGSWGSWIVTKPCSPYCGNGTHVRQRQCQLWENSTSCIGEDEDLMFCNKGDCPVDGQWSEWQQWSPCTIPCGVTNITRTRRCDAPLPSNGGKWCQGFDSLEQTESGTCVASLPCPGSDTWARWGHFGPCTATCGPNAIQTRQRGCEWKEEEFRGVFPCLRTEQETFSCGLLNCPINGSWGEWENWSPCSVSCGEGVRYRIILCDQPPPQYGGKPCPGSQTGSKHETEVCMADQCPPGRYRSAPWSVLRCNTETTYTTRWEWEYAGSTQNGSCPKGQVGVAYRKCSQFGNWLEEDFSFCQLDLLYEIENSINTQTPDSYNFLASTKMLLTILSQDFDGKGLQTSGDLLSVKRILSTLLSWKPFLFPDVTRSEKLDYISTFTSTFERLLHHKYNRLWKKLDKNVLLENLKDFMRIMDLASTLAVENLDKDRFHKYETSASNNLNLMVTSLPTLGKSVKYPNQESSSFRYDKSYIELPTDVISTNQNNNTVQIVFMKYEDPVDDLSSLPLNALLKGGKGFNGRKLNSALVGAKLIVNGKDQHRLRQYVYITFYHKRPSKDHVCTFVDLKSSVSFFNDDGCEIWRKRDDYTICRCDHLTNFALLSHDIIDEEFKYAVREAEYKEYMSLLSYICVGLLLFAFIILLFPGSVSFQGAFLVNSFVFSVIIRHSSVILSILMPLSSLTCLITASIMTYASMACLLWSQLRIFNVEARLREYENSRKQTGLFGASTWLISIVNPATIIVVYMLYDEEMSCELIFSLLIFLPCISMGMLAVICSIGLLVYTTRDFYALHTSLKPIIAKRLELDLWLGGVVLLFTLTATSSTFILFLQTTTPNLILQIFYSVAVLLEILIIFINLWKNQELRAFYNKFFGASPPVQSVVYKPPKYVP